MSIINKELQEIEKTRKTTTIQTPQGDLELGTSFNKHKEKYNRFTAIIFLIIVFAAILLALYHSTSNKHPATRQSPVTTQQPVPPPAATVATAPTAALPPTLTKNAARAATTLKDITLNVENNKTSVNFVLNRETYYYIEHGENPQQLNLLLGNTTYDKTTFPPLNLTHTAIKELSVNKENDNTKIRIETLPDTQVIGLQIYNQPQTALQLTLLNTSTLSPGLIIKTAASPSTRQPSDQEYQEALDALKQKNTSVAIAKLRNTIKTTKDNADAYELLATLLIRSGQLNEATQILDKALHFFPNRPHLNQFKAYILAQQGQQNRALQILVKTPPDINQDPDYYAFVASLYQQQKQFILAAQLYNRLLKIQPDRSMWWMGLGVALESADKKNAAKEAFRHALALGDLPPALQDFLLKKHIKR